MRSSFPFSQTKGVVMIHARAYAFWAGVCLLSIVCLLTMWSFVRGYEYSRETSKFSSKLTDTVFLYDRSLFFVRFRHGGIQFLSYPDQSGAKTSPVEETETVWGEYMYGYPSLNSVQHPSSRVVNHQLLGFQYFRLWTISTPVPKLYVRSVTIPLPVVLIPWILFTGVVLRRKWVLRQRIKHHCCLHCGYELGVLKVRCPECGHRLATS